MRSAGNLRDRDFSSLISLAVEERTVVRTNNVGLPYTQEPRIMFPDRISFGRMDETFKLERCCRV
jgi:hypothetical protein